MLWTPQTVELPAHAQAGVEVSAGRNYIVPGLPVTRLPRPVEMHRVSPRAMAVEMPEPDVKSAPTQAHPLVLHFGFNRWKLTGSDFAKLYALPLASYRVTGYASPPGTPAYNQKLSTQRARVAAGFLKMLGSKVRYHGAGVTAGVTCPPDTLPRNCLPSLREDKVVITRVSPQSLQIHLVPTDRQHLKPRSAEVPPLSGISNTAPLQSPPVEIHSGKISGGHFFALLSADKALWKKLILHPGDLRSVGRQLALATGYTVTVTGPTIALHDMGMPWGKAAPSALVLHKLHSQPFLTLSLNPERHSLHLAVNLED